MEKTTTTQIKNLIPAQAVSILAFCTLFYVNSTFAYEEEYEFEESTILEPFADPYPMTILSETGELFIPNDEQVEIIERLAAGIHSWKTKRDHGWWECGEFSPPSLETEDRAIMLAYELLAASQRYSDDKININVWGLAATIAHESSFDRCAVGYHFRKWAIGKDLIKPRKRTISYGEQELLNAMRSPRARWWFENTGVDVGYCQLLTRFHNGLWEEMMDPVKGIDICASHFRQRATRLRTDRPWRWWRGYKATWYDSRVTHRARVLGAKRNEI